MKKKDLAEKLKGFLSNKRNLIIMIVIVSLIIIGLIKLLFWMIYTQDKPEWVPEETKGKIRKGIEETIGENVKKVSPDLGQAIIDASWDNRQSESIQESDSGWEIYSSSEISINYPDYLVYTTNPVEDAIHLNSISFWDKEEEAGSGNSFSVFDVDIFDAENQLNARDWVELKNNPVGMVSDIIIYGDGWVRAIEAGDPDHFIFVKLQDNKAYQVTTGIEMPGYVNELLKSITIN